MIAITSRLAAAAFGLCASASASAALAASPIGTWIDHTGRGAVEISDCNGTLCGRIVWLKAASHGGACGLQVIGNVKAMAGGRWDGGWIYDPEARSKYDVELTPLGEQKLKVLGYAGMKMFSQTMTWTRAPADLQRCDRSAAVPAPRADAEPRDAQPAAPPTAEPGPDREPILAPRAEGRTRRSKECGIKIDGLGEFNFPCIK